MRGVMAVVRVLLVMSVIGLIANCGDAPTSPDRGLTTQQPTVAFATAGDGNGLSITTDKDDYAPGDTVWFTGAGWTPGDSVDIVLTDSPTEDQHTWTVGIGDDGGFRDSTYVVDVNDIGVTFTLTATSRTNPSQTLTVTFTDGNVSVKAQPDGVQFTLGVTFHSAAACGGTATPQPNVTAGSSNPLVSFGVGNGSNPPSIMFTAAATSTRGATFSAWSGGGTVQSDPKKVCVSGNVNLNLVATYSAAPDLVLAKSHSGSFTAGSTGQYKLVVTNNGTATASGTSSQRIAITDNLPTGLTYASAQSPNSTSTGSGKWNCGAAGQVVTCSYANGQEILPGNSADDLYLTVNVASSASGSVTNQASVSSGAVPESDATNNTASDPTSITVIAPPASKLAFTTDPFTTVVGQCSPKVTVQTQNASGGATNPSATLTVNLSSSSTGGSFYSDAGCATSITSRDILGTGNTADFYYKDTKAGSPKLTAAGGSLTAAEQTETVNQAATTTSISSVSPSPATFGQQVTVNYAVSVTSPGSGTPTGNVDVKDASSTTLCSGTVAAGSCTFHPAGGGTLSLTATYVGDANFSTSTSSPATSLTVNPAPTTTTITSVSPSPATFGQQVTVNFTVAITNTGAGYDYKSLVPTGTVEVKNGSTVLCSATLPATSCQFYPAGAGTLHLAATYGGNANFATSTSSPTTTLTVNRAPTTTTIGTVSPASPHFGQQVTVNFSVVPTNTGAGYDYGSVVPTGTVQVKNGTTLLCSGSLSAAGAGSCTFYASEVGTLSLSAHYIGVSPDFDGDANFLASSTSATTSLTVTRAPTTTSITSPANNASYVLNQPVTVAFTVGPKNTGTGYDYGSVVPTGTVQVKNGTTVLCSGSLTSGAGSCSFPAPAVGGVTFRAYYLGDALSYPGDDQNADANFLASQSSATTIAVSYKFWGLFAPVDTVPTMNSAKAGQAIPLKWRLTDYNNVPVLNFSVAAFGVAATGLDCTAGAAFDAIEEYAGNSGLQNLGDGYYQFNWKTPANYSTLCKKVGLNLGEGFTRGPLAYFQFKK